MNITKTKQKYQPKKHWDTENTCLTRFLYSQTKSVAFSLLRGGRWGKHKKAVQLLCSGTTTESKKSIKDFPRSKLGLPHRKKPSCVNTTAWTLGSLLRHMRQRVCAIIRMTVTLTPYHTIYFFFHHNYHILHNASPVLQITAYNLLKIYILLNIWIM